MEKPMAVSVADCDIMIDAAKRSGVKLMIAHIGHYICENRRAREIVRSRELGDLVMIADTRNVDYFVPSRPRWFLSKELAGGGIFINLGSHSIDKILFLTDSAIKKITGTVNKRSSSDVEGSVQAYVELTNGVSAVVNCSGYKTPYVNETFLYFTEGTLKLATGSGLWMSRGQEYEQVACPDKEQDPFILQLKDFISCIEGNMEPPIPGECSRQVIAAVETVYKCGES
jgi:predicted dehydrogenase